MELTNPIEQDDRVLSIIIAVILILILALLPVYAWPLTRPFVLPALFCYLLFLFLHHDFVLGETGVYHDTLWSTELMATIVKQWLESEGGFGWNPYIGGGQSLAIYNNLFNIFPTFFCYYLFEVFGLTLSSREFFNLVFLFSYFNVCTASLLLMRLITNNNYICVVGFVSVLFGGLFQSELGSPLGLIYLTFLPYLLFFLIHYFKTQRKENILFFCLLLGMSTAYYIPLYHGTALALFIIIAFLAGAVKFGSRYGETLITKVTLILKRPGIVFFSLVLFVVSAGITIYTYMEVQDYVSPSRGYTKAGMVGEKSFVRNVAIAPHNYKKIVNFHEDLQEDVQIATHTTFFIGLIPSLGFFISFFVCRNHIFSLLAIGLAILSVGDQTPVWGWMSDNIPMFKMMRNSFPFGRMSTFCALLAGLLGLAAIFNEKISCQRKIIAIITASFMVVWFSGPSIIIFLFPSVSLLILITYMPNYSGGMKAKYCGMLLLLGVGIHLVGYTLHFVKLTNLEQTSPHKIKKIIYPEKWQMYPSQKPPMPFNLYPMLNKTASWGVQNPAMGFYFQEDFAKFLIEEGFLFVSLSDVPSTAYSLKITNLKYIGPIFHFLPYSTFLKESAGNGNNPPSSDLNEKLRAYALDVIRNKNDKRIASQRMELDEKRNTDLNSIKVNVYSDEGGVLLRMENFHKEWKAYVDGAPTPITKVPPNFQAIQLGKGNHVVELKYGSFYNNLVYAHFFMGVLGFVFFIFWLKNPSAFTCFLRSQAVVPRGSFQ